MKQRTYLDHNATSFMRPSLQQHGLGDIPLNASSMHQEGQKARKYIEAARLRIKEQLLWPQATLTFTATATEANNQLLHGVAYRSLIISGGEHPSILKPASKKGAIIIPLLANGLVNLELLEKALQHAPAPALLSVMAVNNETGVIQPMAEIGEIAAKYGAIFHSDCVQAAGKIVIDITAWQLQALTLSGHKLGGGTGAAALLLEKGLECKALLEGGGQESYARAGTENVMAIHYFSLALQEARHDMPSYQTRLRPWRDAMEQALLLRCPELVIFGQNAPRVANTSCFAMAGWEAQKQLMGLDLAGIAVGSGAACSSGKLQASSVLQSMGVADDLARSSLRVSFGWNSVENDGPQFVKEWTRLYDRFQNRVNL